MRTSGKGEKKDTTRRCVNRERRIHRQIWTILSGINIHFNKGNKSKCFLLKGPNSLNHWNKENEAFRHKYTSKGKKSWSIWAACEHKPSAGVLFLYKRKRGKSLGYLSPKIIFYLKVSPHRFTLSTVLQSVKNKNKQKTHTTLAKDWGRQA